MGFGRTKSALIFVLSRNLTETKFGVAKSGVHFIGLRSSETSMHCPTVIAVHNLDVMA